jgi:hypothetical protein
MNAYPPWMKSRWSYSGSAVAGDGAPSSNSRVPRRLSIRSGVRIDAGVLAVAVISGSPRFASNGTSRRSTHAPPCGSVVLASAPQRCTGIPSSHDRRLNPILRPAGAARERRRDQVGGPSGGHRPSRVRHGRRDIGTGGLRRLGQAEGPGRDRGHPRPGRSHRHRAHIRSEPRRLRRRQAPFDEARAADDRAARIAVPTRLRTADRPPPRAEASRAEPERRGPCGDLGQRRLARLFGVASQHGVPAAAAGSRSASSQD